MASDFPLGLMALIPPSAVSVRGSLTQGLPSLWGGPSQPRSAPAAAAPAISSPSAGSRAPHLSWVLLLRVLASKACAGLRLSHGM